ncbi:hypothetical protein [Mycobacteroides abscessus]|uniref:hypothetical protein n=1 Tax=Mycobacteroides abscessus TaxID=36809 RepID=UPI000925B1AA|nr:hypothetical protein [Mycobacteroides abscessus]MDO2986885.1 hypothetical protein [Mycobacteroides abscessus subsp. abscessus]MDO3208837.1 hypothetical protein [Mycobacteroides abscessus subsp. massiliense]RIS64289.1 hypothetical protein D2E70_25830 [Mycobacteroides abscessus]SIA25729.1 Uncharacterised protein [Mycobacteroides abscessus subsp. abscessus]SID34337.1 Uncharacterised protein [Mycobacteroides abscessus subsp. abscessus]
MATALPPGLDTTVTLIGGPARVGKTTLARRWTCRRTVEFVHLDHFLHALKATATGDTLRALRLAPSIADYSPPEWLAQLRVRDEAMWRSARAYADKAAGPLVMEGGLWPDFVSRLEREHLAIFIVDTGADIADRLVQITHADPHSWMAQRGWPEDKIRKWAIYNRYRSEFIANLATRHGYPVFDIASGIADIQDRALQYLARASAPGEPILH